MKQKFRVLLMLLDTRTNNESFALTPYIAVEVLDERKGLVVGVCWGYWSIAVVIGMLERTLPPIIIKQKFANKIT